MKGAVIARSQDRAYFELTETMPGRHNRYLDTRQAAEGPVHQRRVASG